MVDGLQGGGTCVFANRSPCQQKASWSSLGWFVFTNWPWLERYVHIFGEFLLFGKAQAKSHGSQKAWKEPDPPRIWEGVALQRSSFIGGMMAKQSYWPWPSAPSAPSAPSVNDGGRFKICRRQWQIRRMTGKQQIGRRCCCNKTKECIPVCLEQYSMFMHFEPLTHILFWIYILFFYLSRNIPQAHPTACGNKSWVCWQEIGALLPLCWGSFSIRWPLVKLQETSMIRCGIQRAWNIEGFGPWKSLGPLAKMHLPPTTRTSLLGQMRNREGDLIHRSRGLSSWWYFFSHGFCRQRLRPNVDCSQKKWGWSTIHMCWFHWFEYGWLKSSLLTAKPTWQNDFVLLISISLLWSKRLLFPSILGERPGAFEQPTLLSGVLKFIDVRDDPGVKILGHGSRNLFFGPCFVPGKSCS